MPGVRYADGAGAVYHLVAGDDGQHPRPEFIGIADKGGNIDVLVQALSGVLNSRSPGPSAGRVLKLCGSKFVPWRNAGFV